MTSITDNIRVALYGQYGNDTRFEFTWPEPFNPLDTSGRFQWLRSFTDPRLLREFPGAGRCHLLWSTADGFYYGLVSLQPDDPRGGCALTALFTGRRVFTDGRAAAACLEALHRLLVVEGVRDAAQVEACLAAQPGLRTLAPATPAPAPAAAKVTIGYRAYHNEAELSELLAFRNQKAHEAYHYVALIDGRCAPAAGTPGAPVRIADPLVRQYVIVADDPATTQLSATSAMQGSELTVTYRKAGYQDVVRRHRVGTPDAIATYDGALIRIRPAAAANASFGLRLPVVAVAKGSRTPLSGCWVEVDGVRCPTAEITITETQKATGLTLHVKVGATYYKTTETTVNAATATNGQTLTVELQPQQGVATLTTRLFSLDWTATRELDQPTIARIAKEAPAQGYTVETDQKSKNSVKIYPTPAYAHSRAKKPAGKTSPWLWVALGEGLLILLLAAALVWPLITADEKEELPHSDESEQAETPPEGPETTDPDVPITDNTSQMLYDEVRKNLLYFHDKQTWDDNTFDDTRRNLETLYYQKDADQSVRELLSLIEKDVVTPYYGDNCSQDLRYIIEMEVNAESFDNFIDRLESQIKSWDRERQKQEAEAASLPKQPEPAPQQRKKKANEAKRTKTKGTTETPPSGSQTEKKEHTPPPSGGRRIFGDA